MDTPRLLPGECRQEFFVFFEAAVGELVPNSNLEWLLCIDLAWTMWDIQRYRRWRDAIIMTNQRRAMIEALRRVDPAFSLAEPGPAVRAAVSKKLDSAKLEDLHAQFKKHEYDDVALNAVVFLESAADLATVEKFLASASHQFTLTLREVAVRRDFKLRAEKARGRLLTEDQPLLAKRAEEKGDSV
jgi:hypothetical protein